MRVRGSRFLLLFPLLCASGAGVLPAGAGEYAASDYLPLAVGNSWTYQHAYTSPDIDYTEWPTYLEQAPETPQFMIAVERTEEQDGKTYYVISDMPAFWPPAPPHFIAGKKLRWEGTHLMEYRAGGEQALYRFDGADETGYTVSTEEGDNLVTVTRGPKPTPWYSFSFHEDSVIDWSRGCSFRENFGNSSCGWRIHGEDHPLSINEVTALRAVIGGTPVEFEDALIPTSTSSSTWGEVKQSLFPQGTEEGTDR